MEMQELLCWSFRDETILATKMNVLAICETECAQDWGILSSAKREIGCQKERVSRVEIASSRSTSIHWRPITGRLFKENAEDINAMSRAIIMIPKLSPLMGNQTMMAAPRVWIWVQVSEEKGQWKALPSCKASVWSNRYCVGSSFRTPVIKKPLENVLVVSHKPQFNTCLPKFGILHQKKKNSAHKPKRSDYSYSISSWDFQRWHWHGDLCRKRLEKLW